jgi:hypothetical protein
MTIDATFSWLMPLATQYFDWSHAESFFCPLLELHPQQHKAILSLVMIEASLMMCSQLAADLRETWTGVNATPQ